MDQDLQTSYGIFKKDGNKKLLILTSGVHGSESYAGSAIQDLLFRDYLKLLIPKGIDVAMIQCLKSFWI